MTRDEYMQRLEAELYVKGIVLAKIYLSERNFSSLLKDIACDAFIYPDRYSQELQDETRRRLRQLDTTGVTDS